MANSVVTVTDAMLNDSLLLLVGEDGTVTPDKETVETYLNSKEGTTNIRLMHINKTDKKGVDISVDHLTYVPDIMNEVEITLDSNKTESSVEDIERNLYSFRLDHDYTSFTSPPRIVEVPQLEELVQTLEEDLSEHNDNVNGKSILTPILVNSEDIESKTSSQEFNSEETSSTIPKTTPTVTPIKGKAKVITTGKQSSHKDVSKSSDRVKLKEKPKIVQQIEEEFNDDYANEEDFEDEDYDFQDDENDSDFQIGESKQKTGKKNLVQKNTPTGKKVAKSEKQSKGITKQSKVVTPKIKEQKPKSIGKTNTLENTEEPSKQEKLSDKLQDIEKDKPFNSNADKKVQKKEKKVPKPIPNDFMLFSTPDIIRRVGKDPQNPSTPEIQVNTSPAKITSENRSKSSSADQSPPNFNKSIRLSLDGKSPDKQQGKFDKIENKNKERKPSDKLRKHSTEEKSKCSISDIKKDLNPNKSIKPIILQNIQLSNSMEHLSMETMPTPEDIRSIIMTEDVKSYTTSTLPLVQTSEITSTESIDQSLALDASSLELDQSILDNINNDEISEDILYQVAQSLVGNTDLQNAIDKGLNEGNLVLDPAIQESIAPHSVNQSLSQSTQERNNQKQPPESDIIKKGTQIIRPDGRIVVIPPIERPTTRSRNRNKIEEPPPTKPPIKPLDNEHVSGNELDSTDEEGNQEEEESEDDPNKLWCICNQPHNNRFMICCDTCEEWYHGKCVNITKTMGQQMEEEGREWICLFCKNPTLKRPQAAARRIRKASRASTDSADSSKKIERNVVAKQVTCIVCHKPARENSIYCSQSCILAHASGVDRVVVFEKSTGTMLSGSKAPSSANLEKWLKAHPTFEVYRSGGNIVTSKVQGKKQQQNFTQSKLKIVRNEENHGVSLEVRQKGLKVGILKHLPKHEENIAIKSDSKSPSVKPTGMKSEPVQTQKFYGKTASTPGTKKAEPLSTKPSKTTNENTPTKPKLVQTTLKTTPSSASKEKAQPAKTPKVRQAEQQVTTPQSNSKQQEDIRENVQKTLLEQLTNRIKVDGNIKLEEEELKEISTEIESQLYKCFGDTGQKYRNKYRSLIFNIKDTKNQTLWKRICEKKINAYQLVRLSPDDLASQELALWREREAKHSLDMIKKSELELLNCSRQYVLKTHKGEQVVDEDNRPSDKVDNTEVIRTLTEDQDPEGKDLKSDINKDSPKKGSSKHSHRDKDRESKSSKDRSSLKDHKKKRRSASKDRDRSRRRSSSKDHSSSGKKERKRSRSRDRRRKSSHKSSRHKKESSHISTTDKLDKKSKEILEQLVDNKIVPPLEDRLWKHVPQDDVVPGPAESDSDHEPSSTVTIPTPPQNIEGDEGTITAEVKIVKPLETKESEIERSMSPPLPRKQASEIWRGTISMIDVAHITITAHEVSGDCSDLGEQLPPNLDIVGRISLDTVWDYIGKMKCSNSKIISLIRLNAVNIVEKMPYLALYSYLSSRKRLGVVKSTNRAIKDFYVLPLAPQKPIPQALLPLNGPGFEESRPALLLGIIVRDKRKRGSVSDQIYPSLTPKKSRISTPPLPVGTPPVVADAPTLVQPPRSYTPPSAAATPPLPVNKDPRVKLIIPPPPAEKEVDDGDEPYSPEDSDPDNTSIIGQSFTELPPVINPKVIPPTTTAAPYTFTSVIPGLDVGTPLPASTLEIQKQMEELNKKIEAQKSEIHSISKNLVSASTEIGQSALANIALPSNLQQILDSIKTISNEETPAQSKPVDPNLTIPLMLPKSFSRPLNTGVPPPLIQIPPKPDFPTNTIPLNLPTKAKLKLNSPHSGDSPGLLSSLSEEELVKKAAEMLGETIVSPPTKEKLKVGVTNTSKRQKLENDLNFDIEPPIPGVDN